MVALFEVLRLAMSPSSAAGCDGAGLFEESDEERFYGWETRGYNANVHFDDLPDVCCHSQLVEVWATRKICDEVEKDIQNLEPWPVKSSTSKKWYCIGVLQMAVAAAKKPRLRIQTRPVFVRVVSCNFHTSGMGRIANRRSVAMLMAVLVSA